MASSRVSTAIVWSTNASITMNTTAAFTSDAFTYNAEDWDASIQVNADNQGTPSSGDYVDLWIAYTSGDVLGDTGSDYDTTEHAVQIGRLNTYGTDTPGEDPARGTYKLDTAPLGFKLISQCPTANTRNVILRAMVVTHRPQ